MSEDEEGRGGVPGREKVRYGNETTKSQSCKPGHTMPPLTRSSLKGASTHTREEKVRGKGGPIRRQRDEMERSEVPVITTQRGDK